MPGTIGCTPALSMASMASKISDPTPAPPRAMPFSRASMTARTTSAPKLGPDSGGVAQDHVALELRLLLVGQAPVLERPEVRGDPVDGLVEPGQPLDHGARGPHGLSGLLGHRHRSAAPGHARHLLDGEVIPGEDDIVAR